MFTINGAKDVHIVRPCNIIFHCLILGVLSIDIFMFGNRIDDVLGSFLSGKPKGKTEYYMMNIAC